MSIRHFGYALLCSVATAALLVPIAKAQEPGGGLEEITVTARKTAETLISVPVAVTALTAQDLQVRGAVDPLVDLAAYTPGFTFQNQSVNRNDRGFRTFTMRGMVPNTPTASRQAVSVFVDGTAVDGGNVEGLSDIERVEVVKGPQSAYFGRSTFAGAINYITRDPGNKWGGQADVNVGEFGLTEVSADLEGPVVTDKLAFRLGGRSYHTDGDYTNMEEPGQKLGQRDTKSISGTLVATPTDNLKAKVYVNVWRDDDGEPANAQLNSSYYNCNGGAAAAGTLNYICGPIRVAPQDTRLYNTVQSPYVYQVLTGVVGPGYNIYNTNFLQHMGLKRDAWQVHGNIDYSLPNNYVFTVAGAHDLNKWAFITDTTFRNTQNTALFPNPNYTAGSNLLPYFARSAYGANQDQDSSVEARLTSPREERLKWMAGANWFHGESLQLTNAFGPTGFIPATPANLNTNDTYGLFASGSYEIVSRLTLSVEGRYQWDKLYQETAAGTNLIGNPANVTAAQTYHAFTPRAILDYKFTDNASVYASYSQGTRPGEFNTVYGTLAPDIKAQVDAVAHIVPAVPEEKVKMGEVGVKGDFLDNTLRVLAAAYYGDWTNRHIPVIINTFRNGTLFQGLQFIIPGGITHLSGFELESTWKATKELTFEGSFDLAASKIINTFCTDCRLITGNPNPTGTQLPYYSKYHANLAATYERPITSDILGFIRVDYIYTGQIYDTEADIAWLVPTNKINLHVGAEKGNYRVELYGTNITDNRVPTSLARNADSFTTLNAISLSLPDKATYGIRMSAKF